MNDLASLIRHPCSTSDSDVKGRIAAVYAASGEGIPNSIQIAPVPIRRTHGCQVRCVEIVSPRPGCPVKFNLLHARLYHPLKRGREVSANYRGGAGLGRSLSEILTQDRNHGAAVAT